MANTSGAVAERNHCTSHIELLFRFSLWASQLGRLPLPEEIAGRYSLSISNAYRWRNAWCDANGLPIPDKRPFGTRPDHFNASQRRFYRERNKRPRETPSPAATGTSSNPDQRIQK